MSDISVIRHDPVPPPRVRERLIWLSAAIIAPPLLWGVQLLLLTAYSDYACFPGEAPSPVPWIGWVPGLESAVNVLAVLVAIISGVVSLCYFRFARRTLDERRDPISVLHFERLSFLALGGLLSSGGFLCAIVSECIASGMVRLCMG